MDCIHRIGDTQRDFANLQNQREKYMLSKLKPKIKDVLEIYPRLKDKQSINVLLILGAVHTRLHNQLKRSNQYETVNREFNVIPFSYSFHDEARRRYLFSRPLTDTLLGRVFLENIFTFSFFDVRGFGSRPSFINEEVGSVKIESFKRKIISQFSFEEAREIFEKLKQGESAWQLFETKFVEKGIKIPSSEKELDEYLAKPMTKNQ